MHTHPQRPPLVAVAPESRRRSTRVSGGVAHGSHECSTRVSRHWHTALTAPTSESRSRSTRVSQRRGLYGLLSLRHDRAGAIHSSRACKQHQNTGIVSENSQKTTKTSLFVSPFQQKHIHLPHRCSPLRQPKGTPGSPTRQKTKASLMRCSWLIGTSEISIAGQVQRQK